MLTRPKTSNIHTYTLNDTFDNRWTGRGGPITCPPRSPVLTPLDFHFWGTWKPWCTRLPWRYSRILWHELNSSWNQPWYAENLSKRSAWHNQAIHKMCGSWWRPYWTPVNEWNDVYWQYFNYLLYSFPSFCGPNCLHPPPHFRDANT